MRSTCSDGGTVQLLPFLYRPLIARSEYVGVESRRLVNRLFGGRAAPLFAQLAESEALTDDDLTEIEALLREMRK